MWICIVLIYRTAFCFIWPWLLRLKINRIVPNHTKIKLNVKTDAFCCFFEWCILFCNDCWIVKPTFLFIKKSETNGFKKNKVEPTVSKKKKSETNFDWRVHIYKACTLYNCMQPTKTTGVFGNQRRFWVVWLVGKIEFV